MNNNPGALPAPPPYASIQIPSKSPKLRKYINKKIVVERNGTRKVGILRSVYPVMMPYGPPRTWVRMNNMDPPSFPIFRTTFYEHVNDPLGPSNAHNTDPANSRRSRRSRRNAVSGVKPHGATRREGRRKTRRRK